MFFSTVRFVKIRLKVTRLLRGCFVYWVQNTNCFGQTQFVIFQDDEIQLKNNMKNQDFINSVQVIYLELKKLSNLFITLSSVLFYKIQSVFFRLRLIKKRSRQQKFSRSLHKGNALHLKDSHKQYPCNLPFQELTLPFRL